MANVWARGAALAAGLCIAGSAAAQHQMFRCGATYQDRPCADETVQKRYSRAAGRFDVPQVRADTDRDCALQAAGLMPFWRRLHDGDTVERVQPDFEQGPGARLNKGAARDELIVLREVQGTPAHAQGELEVQCMDAKRRAGVPTEREIAAAGAPGAYHYVPLRAGYDARIEAARRRSDAAAARAAAARAGMR
ncbi:MAG TPA: hypothetical protein VFE82_09715 [Ramlibacter sp.]|uniref:hypothetical protein n=1 Tax=Ramlibacter sp. TaxID=1917967 RepID=UPI002D607C11|nr:hypothetical protein [Ramlibacter sp.]HZY18749.1 hypothetical protein [Ramlibacter sp.]